MAMGFPMYGVVAAGHRLFECILTDLLIVLGRRGFACDHAARKDNVWILGASRFGEPQQRVLAGTAWSDHQNKPAGRDHRWRMICIGGSVHHATRWPSRQTLRTTGMPRATCTRIRSARLPATISPRSVRPTASAGVLVTVRTAEAKSIAGTRRGNSSAAIRRLE